VAEQRGEQKTIYVRASDVDLWRRAESYARARRLTMSALIMTALEAYLDQQQGASDRRDP
jgi:post-segregation antitoxin (ccd killing protein)